MDRRTDRVRYWEALPLEIKHKLPVPQPQPIHAFTNLFCAAKMSGCVYWWHKVEAACHLYIFKRDALGFLDGLKRYLRRCPTKQVHYGTMTSIQVLPYQLSWEKINSIGDWELFELYCFASTAWMHAFCAKQSLYGLMHIQAWIFIAASFRHSKWSWSIFYVIYNSINMLQVDISWIVCGICVFGVTGSRNEELF